MINPDLVTITTLTLQNKKMLLTSSWCLDLTVFLLTGIYLLHKYMSRNYDYWQKRGVYCPKPVPFFGNFREVLFLQKNLADWIKELYDSTADRFVGAYIFDKPYFIARDPALIKSITVKDFNYFVDRNIADPAHCQITSHIMFMQKNHNEWKEEKSKVSTMYTPAKIKGMFPLFVKSANDLKEYVQRNRHKVIDARTLAERFSTDIISICAFGINSHCFEDTDSEFTTNAKDLFKFTLRNAFSQLIYFFKPSWVNPLKLHFFKTDALAYFANVFLETAKSRKDTENVNDLVDIVNNLVKDKMLKGDGSGEATICGIAIQVFAAGYETASMAVSFTLYEMALNPDVQAIARKEIEDVIKKHGGGLTYDAVQDMFYLEMCIHESLRKYPSSAFLDRRCNKDYQIPDSDVVIEKGTPVLFPLYGLYRDEKYYPEPDRYDPERFRNKFDNSQGVYFMPFGSGPRGCVGERFGRLMTKMALLGVLRDFEVVKCKQTPKVIEFSKKSFMIMSTVGAPVKFVPLESKN